MLDADVKSGIQIAVERAADQDEGRQQLSAFDDSLKKLAADRPDDWSVSAMRLVIALAVDADDAGPLLEQLVMGLSQLSGAIPALNQLTRLAHTLRQLDHTGRLERLLSRIDHLLGELL